MALWCLSLTVEQRSAAVVHHRHLLQLGAFADVRQQGAATFDLLLVQLWRGGVGLRGVDAVSVLMIAAAVLRQFGV